MSQASKARREARKKRERHEARSTTKAPIFVAQLMLDSTAFASVAVVKSEWLLVMNDGPAAGSSDPHVIWDLISELASRAEANGNFVSLQSHTEFRRLLDESPRETSEDIAGLADKVLSVYPLPLPRARN